MDNVAETLKRVFGFDQFRSHQQGLVEALTSGKDVFGVMPTGGGKSLCYQLPAVLSDGCAVVVSPLIALMKVQVDAARANGIRATCVNSSRSMDERREAARLYRSGELDLLYVAPERLVVSGFLDRLRDCPKGAPAFFAVDEAHCLSEWGHDFRPDYLILTTLKETFPDVPVAAFTATATETVAKDIETKLKLYQPHKIRASFDRANLFYEVRAKRDWETQLVQFIKERAGQSGIIYRTTRKSVEATASLLNANGIPARAYHAGMENEDRSAVQEAFIRDNCQIIVATIAFGMGIDKADVRYVIHGDLPKNIESYYQETGRAGRDGEPSHCLLLYSPADMVKLRRFLDDVSDANEKQRSLKLLQAMERFAATPQCRRRNLLGYFNETYPHENCGSCDYCLGEFQEVDATRDAQIVLSAIVRTGERFGAVHVCDVVCGANTARIREFRHEQLKTWGVGKDQPKTYWRSVLDALIAKRLVTIDGDYTVPKMTPKAWAVLKGQQTFARHEDTRIEPEKTKRGTVRVEENFAYHSGLFGHLRALRKEIADTNEVPPYVVFADKSLRQMAALMPTSENDLLKIHGVGAHKMATYGAPFLTAIQDFLAQDSDAASQRLTELPTAAPVAAPSCVNKPLSETFQVTLALLKAGKSPEAIASERGCTLTTVGNHIGRLIEHGEDIDWRAYVPEEVEALARQLFLEYGTEALKPIFEASGKKVSYEQARIILAVMAKE
jgi:ATP-dependent DNA helicase RecQ